MALEALLLGGNPLLESSLELMNRLDHAVTVADDGQDQWDAFVSKIADHTAALIAAATPEQLAAAMEPWSQTEEFVGHVSAADLGGVMEELQPLFRRAVDHARHVHVRTSC